MKLDEGDAIVDVEICTEARRRAADHGAPASASASRCRRCACSRAANSTGVRGIALGEGDTRHLDGDPAPFRGDRRRARRLSEDAPRGARRGRAGGGAAPDADDEEASDDAEAGALGQERYAEMSAAEQFVLTVSENGYGKRTSSYEYRIDRPRRQGHRRHGGRTSATAGSSPSFPVEDERPDHAGHRRRPAHPLPVGGAIRIAGRGDAGRHRRSTRRTRRSSRSSTSPARRRATRTKRPRARSCGTLAGVGMRGGWGHLPVAINPALAAGHP